MEIPNTQDVVLAPRHHTIVVQELATHYHTISIVNIKLVFYLLLGKIPGDEPTAIHVTRDKHRCIWRETSDERAACTESRNHATLP